MAILCGCLLPQVYNRDGIRLLEVSFEPASHREWAGEIRTVDIKKNEDSAEFFLVVGKIIDAVVVDENDEASRLAAEEMDLSALERCLTE